MRESWTDERLDDLRERVDQGFAHVDADIRELRRTVFQCFVASITVTVTCFVGLAGLIVF